VTGLPQGEALEDEIDCGKLGGELLAFELEDLRKEGWPGMTKDISFVFLLAVRLGLREHGALHTSIVEE
jgi:hypothetical protein